MPTTAENPTAAIRSFPAAGRWHAPCSYRKARMALTKTAREQIIAHDGE
jgi:hypothetical protein